MRLQIPAFARNVVRNQVVMVAQVVACTCRSENITWRWQAGF